MLKLNNLSNDIFTYNKELGTKVNAAGKELIREEIVAQGRLVACEKAGMEINKRNNSVEKYVSRLNGENVDYTTFAQKHLEQKLLFCAAQSYKAVGKDPSDLTIDDVKNNMGFAKDITFIKTLAAIDSDVITPLFFKVMDDASQRNLLQWESTRLGATKEINIKSNDAFLWEDSAFGSLHSGSYNYLYGDSVAITPKMKTCRAKIKYYQDIVNGDAGDYYMAMIRGYESKIYAMFVNGLSTASANVKYMPSNLQASTYSETNWNTIIQRVAAANGIDRNSIIALGDAAALAKVIPSATGFQMGLGEEWFKNGYIGNKFGVDLVEVKPVVVPGTQNTSITPIFPNDEIYFVAKAGTGYAPMYGVYVDGTPITITMSVDDTADGTIDLEVAALFDIAPIFASKVGRLTNV